MTVIVNVTKIVSAHWRYEGGSSRSQLDNLPVDHRTIPLVGHLSWANVPLLRFITFPKVLKWEQKVEQALNWVGARLNHLVIKSHSAMKIYPLQFYHNFECNDADGNNFVCLTCHKFCVMICDITWYCMILPMHGKRNWSNSLKKSWRASSQTYKISTLPHFKVTSAH